jgi:hypothetical protein
MTTISRSQQAAATMKLALIAAATVGVAIGVPATAHANELSKFASPSGNIRCVGSGGAGFVVCEIRDYTYVVPNNDITGCQDSRWPRGNVVEIATGGTDWTCPGIEFDSGPWPTLDYGQTRSLGAITCDSEPSGMTCTDSRTGHFFRVSRDSYQVG